jgi:tetratricopeptide (TPR) repeat protein
MAKGDALIECGGVYIDCANPDKAQELYQDALRTYDSILELTSDPVAHIDACINKGRVWETIGDQLADVQPDDAAEQAYREAIALYNTALQDVPDHDVALACKGFALMRLGDKLANVQRDDAAEQAYHEAIAAYNRILQTYEDHLERLFKPGSQSVYVLHNIGLVLTKLGKLFDLRSDHTQAQRHYEEAIIFYDSVLKNAANTIQTLNDKGRALFRLAESRNATNDRSEAIDALHDAIACWERSLLLGPNDQNIHDLLTAARPRLDEWERGVTL